MCLFLKGVCSIFHIKWFVFNRAKRVNRCFSEYEVNNYAFL